MTQKEITPRLDYLDSLRGLASLSVLLYHWLGAYLPTSIDFISKKQFDLISIFINGADAVSFFFVLSGLVLSMKYFHGTDASKSYPFKSYAIARCFRLYPAFWIWLGFSFLYIHHHEPHQYWVKLPDILMEASLIKNYYNYYGAGWTLNVEIVMSLFLPFLVILAKQQGKYLNYLLAFFLLSTSFFNIFLFHFTLGIYIAYHFKTIANGSIKQSSWHRYRYALIPLVIILYSSRHISSLLIHPDHYQIFHKYTGLDYFHFSAMAAFIILIFTISHSSIQTFLEHRLLLFLGKISYGLYLVHWFWLFSFFNLKKDLIQSSLGINDFQTICIIGFLVLIFSIISATLLHYWVEIPMIKKGKAIFQKSNV